MGDKSSESDWHDKEIRFDVKLDHLELRRGETVIDALASIEDTKGNNGYKLKNDLDFQLDIQNKPQHRAVFRAYESSKMYRELKLRGAVIKDKELIILPDEQVFNKIPGVWNLSADQGNLGTFFLTNIRIVWFANLAENFNVSIPYIQIKSVRVRESKFGPALVLGTSQRSGSYILGFRIDPADKLGVVKKEVSALWETYSADPNFGVQHSVEDQAPKLKDLRVHRKVDDVEIVDTDEANRDVLAAYYADGTKGVDREPELNPYLGLAVESLQDGVSIEQLWSVL